MCLKRKSIRRFTGQTVTREQLDEILKTTLIAPSAGNMQAYEIVVVKDGVKKDQLVKAALGQSFIAQAPVVLVFVALPLVSMQRYGNRGANLYCIQDATIACTYAMLTAQELGLSTTWVGAFNEEEVRSVVGADSNETPVAILPIGYKNEEPWKTPRKSMKQMIRVL